jgi:hypothetical protein
MTFIVFVLGLYAGMCIGVVYHSSLQRKKEPGLTDIREIPRTVRWMDFGWRDKS